MGRRGRGISVITSLLQSSASAWFCFCFRFCCLFFLGCNHCKRKRVIANPSSSFDNPTVSINTNPFLSLRNTRRANERTFSRNWFSFGEIQTSTNFTIDGLFSCRHFFLFVKVNLQERLSLGLFGGRVTMVRRKLTVSVELLLCFRCCCSRPRFRPPSLMGMVCPLLHVGSVLRDL